MEQVSENQSPRIDQRTSKALGLNVFHEISDDRLTIETSENLVLNFESRPLSFWRELLWRAKKSNWLQTIMLAKVLHERLKKSTKLCTIEQQDKILGFCAFQEFKIGPISMVEVFRGPIWFENDPPFFYLLQFAKAFAERYPRKLLFRRRWLPEWQISEDLLRQLKFFGFKKKRGRDYATSWINLQLSMETLYANLDRKWRHSLNKGLKLSPDIRYDESGQTAASFASYHAEDQAKKKYHGRTGDFLRDELLAAAHFKELLILYLIVDEEPVAGVAIVMHGNSATYRASWSNEKGRNVQAHNVLLWEAIKKLKGRGRIHWFDLSGLTGARTKGLAHFKRGMGGSEFVTPGVLG